MDSGIVRTRLLRQTGNAAVGAPAFNASAIEVQFAFFYEKKREKRVPCCETIILLSLLTSGIPRRSFAYYTPCSGASFNLHFSFYPASMFIYIYFTVWQWVSGSYYCRYLNSFEENESFFMASS